MNKAKIRAATISQLLDKSNERKKVAMYFNNVLTVSHFMVPAS